MSRTSAIREDGQISFRFKTAVDSELGGTLDETREKFLRVSDEDSNGNGHASLTGGTKCSTSNRVQRVVDVGWDLGLVTRMVTLTGNLPSGMITAWFFAPMLH